MTTADAVTAFDDIAGDDPGRAHSAADDILLALVPDEIRAAYQRVQRWSEPVVQSGDTLAVTYRTGIWFPHGRTERSPDQPGHHPR